MYLHIHTRHHSTLCVHCTVCILCFLYPNLFEQEKQNIKPKKRPKVRAEKICDEKREKKKWKQIFHETKVFLSVHGKNIFFATQSWTWNRIFKEKKPEKRFPVVKKWKKSEKIYPEAEYTVGSCGKNSWQWKLWWGIYIRKHKGTQH